MLVHVIHFSILCTMSSHGVSGQFFQIINNYIYIGIVVATYPGTQLEYKLLFIYNKHSLCENGSTSYLLSLLLYPAA